MGRGRGSVVVDRRRSSPVYGLRFHANGQRHYQRLGTAAEGWTRQRAEVEMENVLADVRRAIWQPPKRRELPVEDAVMPTFREFSSEWFAQRKAEGGHHGHGLAPKSAEDLEWRLANHLLPVFGDVRLDEITIELVDRYRRGKVQEGTLAPATINKLIATLAAVLEDAVEYELIGKNPARGRRRRLKAPLVHRSWIDRAEHIQALLDGAGQLDKDARTHRGQRRALVATLVFGGLRIGEALGLRWRDVDLARATIIVRASKTDAGIRTVNMLPSLRDELAAYRASRDASPEMLVFATSSGGPLSPTNVRKRVLAAAVTIANERLGKLGVAVMPDRLTPHSLRRTYASLLYALGETPPYVMAQMGHTSPNLALAIYAKAMDRRDGEPERLKALTAGRTVTPVPSLMADAA